MKLTRRRQGDIEVVALQGRLDAFTSAAIREQILELVEAGVGQLIVDMTSVSFVSSVGLRLLLVAAKRQRELGGRFGVASLQPTVHEAFEFAGLEDADPPSTKLDWARAIMDFFLPGSVQDVPEDELREREALSDRERRRVESSKHRHAATRSDV